MRLCWATCDENMGTRATFYRQPWQGEIKSEAIVRYRIQSSAMQDYIAHTLRNRNNAQRLVIVMREIYGHDTQEIYGHKKYVDLMQKNLKT